MANVDRRIQIRAGNDRLGLKGIAFFLLVVLCAKVLFTIVYEFRWYFPANFDESAFLTGRKVFFKGIYKVAFYAHIIAGPISLVLGFLLMQSGKRFRWLGSHRWIGKPQALIVIAIVCPSGFVMSLNAYTGHVAGTGFALLAIVTAVAMFFTAYYAIKKQFIQHRQWATRCFILLCSPLILRLTSGLFIILGRESSTTYQLSAWLCWFVPLAIYEIRLRSGSIPQNQYFTVDAPTNQKG